MIKFESTKLNIKFEEISLDISNYWTSNDFLTESNKNCGTLVAFDWRCGYLTEINTNIVLSDLEIDNFKFDVFAEFLKENNFTFVLGLRNTGFSDNPSVEWIDSLKEILESKKIRYDEYVTDQWPSPIPKFEVPDNIFILRYSYDEYSKIDKFASTSVLFQNFIETSEWKEYYKNLEDVLQSKKERTVLKFDPENPDKSKPMSNLSSEEKIRVIVFCSDIENLVLRDRFYK